MEIQKFEYLENAKSFLDEISIFCNYLRTTIQQKIETAGTSFKNNTIEITEMRHMQRQGNFS